MKIKKLRIFNFKKFEFLEIDFKENLNIIVGDNESGKSSILLAIDLVLAGSRTKVESAGLELLFNSKAVENFFSTNTYETLPKLTVELYFDNLNDAEFYGRNNSLNTDQFGISMICEPRDDLSKDIAEILKEKANNFPFEYYSISFIKFSGSTYSGLRRYFKHILLDSTLINNEYATNAYIKTLYATNVSPTERSKHFNEYRKAKKNFSKTVLADLNKKTGSYAFDIRSSTKANLETDLTITEDEIDIQNRGKGRQCFIKTEFALQGNKKEIDFILLEEPENHLSHLHMQVLVDKINESKNKQVFIATHSSLISTRLDLRNTILLNSNSSLSAGLKDLDETTASFFIKASNNNILEFVLSKKILLVEGDAEYILCERFFEIVAKTKPHLKQVHIISVGGTSFKRYLEIAALLKIKTAVITDNDGDFDNNCTERYKNYVSDLINIFSETDSAVSTFEISMYKRNTVICDELFGAGRKTRTVQQFMLAEKAECAFELLSKKNDALVVPSYIQKGIEWLISA